MTFPEIHLTNDQRATVAELLADNTDASRLGACSISATDEFVAVHFEHETVYVNERGAIS